MLQIISNSINIFTNNKIDRNSKKEVLDLNDKKENKLVPQSHENFKI